MPTYEYHCKTCGNHFDVQASIAEKERGLDVTCTQCGSKLAERVFAGIAMFTGQANKDMPRSPNSGCSCGGNCV